MMQATKVNIDDYELVGEGANGLSYNHKSNPSVMLKMYMRNFEAAEQELVRAQKVYAAGIPTPEPGDLVTDGTRTGILFRRMVDKKSYARAVSDDPEHVEDYAREFAGMCRQLHQTHVDTTQFVNVKDHYLNLLNDNPYFTPEQKVKIRQFILDAPQADTAIHGDLHFGNAIFVDRDGHREKYFIDLGDFCYGCPMFDVSMVYLTCILSGEEFIKNAFHINKQMSSRFWKAFAPVYFGEDADMEAIEKEVRIYAGLKTLIIERDTHRPMPEFRAMLEGTIY